MRPLDQDNQKSEQENEPPKSLIEMEEETEGIINKIEDVKKEREKQERESMQPSKPQESKPDQQQEGQQDQENGQQDDQVGNDQQEDDQEEDGQGEGDQEEDDQEEGQNQAEEEESHAQIPLVNWSELEDSMENIHKKWTSYEPLSLLVGISDDLITSFELELNLLTESILARDEDNTLYKANSLYSHYPRFLNAYKHNQPPEVKEVKYLVRQAMILGQQLKWVEAKELMPLMKKAWETSKARMKDEDKDEELNKKIDAVIHDFSFLIESEKINLAKIKGNILMDNLDEVK